MGMKADFTLRSLELVDITNRTDRPICCGGYGDVWKAKLRGSDVALKTLRPHTYATWQSLLPVPYSAHLI